jgi:glycosyltransferase involved in cell wall biosynthesis
VPEPLRVAHLTTVDMSLAWLLATELRVDVEAGLKTYGISAPGPFVAQVEALGVRHVPVPGFTRSWGLRDDLAAARQLHRVLRGLGLHVLHTHTPKAGVLGRVLGRAARIPVVVNTCHGLWVRDTDSPAKQALVYGAEAVAAVFSDAELYQNDTDRRTLRRVVRARKARTVGNGVDLERFRRDPAAGERLRAELGVADDEVLVGGVGRRVAEKGIAEFATVAQALGERARFVWVGPDDPGAPSLGHPSVLFLGQRDDMPAVYSALDVFVLPSHREGFSRSAMEAAACGCALVLSDIRGCREIGTDDQHLLLVPPRDPAALTAAVARLLDDPDLRARLAAAAESRARAAFDQRTVAAASLATYRAVARRKGLDWWQQVPEG